MSTTLSARRRAARRHWSRILPHVVVEDYWPADVHSPDEGRHSAPKAERRTIDESLAARIRAVSSGDLILVHTLLTAALAVCFAARRGARTVWLAVPPTRSTTPDEEIGGVMAVLPTPVPVDPDATGADLLSVTRRALLDAYDAQYGDPPSPSGEAGEPEGQDPSPPVLSWLVEHGSLHRPVRLDPGFDGVVRIDEGPDPALSVTGAAHLFTSASLGRLADQIIDVLAVLVAEPGTRLAAIPRWRAADRESALAAARSEPGPPGRVPAVEELVGRTVPGRAAVVAEDGALSHEELAERAAAAARGLHELMASADRSQAGPKGTLHSVALLTGQGAATVVGACAALRAGIPYVVVPPDHTDDWALLRERGVTVAITASPLPDPAPPGIAVCDLDELIRRGRESTVALPDAPPPDTPAYLIFTSGSTGMAKTVVVTRGNLAVSNAARQAVYGTEPADFLLLSPLHFDSSVAGLYWTLGCGGTLHIAPPSTLRDPALLVELIARHGITATLGLPRVLGGITRAATGDQLRSLRVVVGAGESFPAGLAATLRLRAPGVRVVNEYGPSEATVWATYHDVADDETDVPIGRPVPGTRVHVLDGWGEVVPPGFVGQLAIGGPQVSAGYANAAELTRERFVTDRFDGDPGDRLYLTGDEGYVGPDGALRFVGRADDEVKVRGVRLRLADVAAAFRAHDAVEDAEALLVQGLLVIFLAGGKKLDGDAVLTAVRPSLGAHAVPGRVIVVSRLPQLSSGKCDREELLALAHRAPSSPHGRRPPADELERHVLALFHEVLGADDVGVDDNFFTAGGDSIKAALLTAQLSREMSTYLYVVALLDNPTPAELTTYLRREYGKALAASGMGGRGPRETAPEREAAPHAVSRADTEAGERLRRLISAAHGGGGTPGERLPSPVFVLGPPRSGTTLMRIILSGHPELFAPPELELLQYGTLAERRAALSGRYTFNREGLVRAVMSLQDDTVQQAEAFLDQVTDEGWSVADAYHWLTERAGGRTLVDKTTAYALDAGTLRRAEELFDGPRYIHLTRHPQACIASFLEARLDQTYLRADHGFTPEESAELVWRLAHEQASAFLDGIDPARVMRVSFEELVADPGDLARRLCAFLGITYDPRILQVYDDQRTRMTDGLRPGGRMLGDIKFYEHHSIDASAADRWRTGDTARPLHPRTAAVARELGYGPEGRITETGLTSQQRFMWFLEFMRPDTAMYNVPMLLAGEGAVDDQALRRAVRTVARRHHAFRSVVVTPDQEPVLRFVPDLSPAVTIQEVPADLQRERAEHLARRPFDVERESLLRVHLLRDGDRFTLLLLMHHIVADAWSLRFVVGDLLEAYEQWRAGSVPSQAALPRQIADASFEEAELDLASVDELTERVRRRLTGAAWPLNLPPASGGGDGELSPVVEVRLPIDPATAAAVRRYAAARGCSLYRVLLVAFGWTLATLTGDRDICVGTPVLRRGPQDERTVGLFVNTALVRLDLTGSVSFDDLVGRAEAAVRDAIADAELPYEEVVAALADQVGAGGTLLQAVFSVQRVDVPLDLSPSLRLRRLVMSPQYAKFDIAVSVADEDGRLAVTAELAATRFDESAARRFVTGFVGCVQRLVSAPAAAMRAGG
ncbi:condensation domain-containing protein [Streptosporangium sp. CA-115845]|uniref:condensation domain-containing protein n=1 Tax=Streptosporangium sp. CA-115845 TaxID=3240071 RepID=UPI003D8B267E